MNLLGPVAFAERDVEGMVFWNTLVLLIVCIGYLAMVGCGGKEIFDRNFFFSFFFPLG